MMLRKRSIFLIVAMLQLSNGQSLHAGRYFASAPVFASAPSLPSGPAPCGPPGFLPVAAPPIMPPPVPGFAFAPPIAPPPLPIPAAIPSPLPFGPAIAAFSPGVMPSAPPPMAACAPGFPTGGFGPFGSNKKNERHPIEQEAVDTQPMTESTTTIDPNAPKLEAKRKVPVEIMTNSTQTTILQSTHENVTDSNI